MHCWVGALPALSIAVNINALMDDRPTTFPTRKLNISHDYVAIWTVIRRKTPGAERYVDYLLWQMNEACMFLMFSRGSLFTETCRSIHILAPVWTFVRYHAQTKRFSILLITLLARFSFLLTLPLMFSSTLIGNRPRPLWCFA